MPKADKGGEAVLKRRLLFLYTLGWIVAGIALSALTYFVLAPKVSLALVFLYGALFSMMFFAIAVQTEAARRLVTLTNYPPLDEIPAHLKTEHPKSVKGASKPRSRPKAVPKEGGGGTLPDVGK